MIRIITLEDKNIKGIIDYEKVKDILTTNVFNCLVGYFIDNKIIGYVMYMQLYEDIDINDVYIDEPYRNRGIAYNLIRYIIDNNEFNNISLEVNMTNEPAINLYKKVGFKVASIRTGYYKGIDGLLMVRSK